MKWKKNYLLILYGAPATILLMSAFLSCEAVAQPVKVEFKLLPPGTDGQIQGVGRVRYYLLGEYLALNNFDQELVKLRLDVQDLNDIVIRKDAQLGEKDKVASALQDDIEILRARGLRADEDLKECEKTVLELAGGPWWPYILAATGSAVGIAGIITGAYYGAKYSALKDK